MKNLVFFSLAHFQNKLLIVVIVYRLLVINFFDLIKTEKNPNDIETIKKKYLEDSLNQMLFTVSCGTIYALLLTGID